MDENLMVSVAVRGREDRVLMGISLMLLTYFLFSCVDTSSKWLSLSGLPVFQLVFTRYFVHLLISLGLLLKSGTAVDAFVTHRPKTVLLRALCLFGATMFNFIALQYLPLTLISTIVFSVPIMVCVFSGPLLGERVGKWRWFAVGMGFLGVLVAIRPLGETFHWAMSLSMMSAGCFALYTLLTRKLAGEVSTETMQLYSGLTGTVLMIPLVLTAWQMPETFLQWVLLIGLGAIGWLAHELMTVAHRFAPASTLSPFSYILIIYMGGWGYFVFHRVPDIWTVVGAAIVMSAGLFIGFRERLNHRTK